MSDIKINHTLLNSTLLFVLTSMLVTFLHEGGHAITAWTLGVLNCIPKLF